MATPTNITIRLNADNRGGETIKKSLSDIEKQSKSTGAAFQSFANAQTSFMGIAKNAAIFQGVQTLLRQFAQIPLSMDSIIERGNRFNLVMEGAKNQLAGVFRNAAPEKFTSMSAAMLASANAIEMIRKAAKETRISQQQLVAAFQSSAGAMTLAGAPIERQIRLVADFTAATATFGTEAAATGEDLRKLFSGTRGKKNDTADWLGLTKEDVEKAHKQGNILELLEERVKNLKEELGGKDDSFVVAKARLEDSLDEATGNVSETAMKQISKGFIDLSEAIKAIPTETLNEIGKSFANLVNLGSGIVQLGTHIAFLVPTIGKLAAAFAGVKIGQKILASMPKMIANGSGQGAALLATNTAAASAASALSGTATRADARWAKTAPVAANAEMFSANESAFNSRKNALSASAASRDASLQLSFAKLGGNENQISAATKAADMAKKMEQKAFTESIMKSKIATEARTRAEWAATRASEVRAKRESMSFTNSFKGKGVAGNIAGGAGVAMNALAVFSMAREMGKFIGEETGLTNFLTDSISGTGNAKNKEEYDAKLGKEFSALSIKNREEAVDETSLGKRKSATQIELEKLKARALNPTGDDKKFSDILNDRIKLLEGELKSMERDPKQYLKNAAEHREATNADSKTNKDDGRLQKAKMESANFTDADYKELERLRAGESDDAKKVKEAKETLAKAKKEFDETQKLQFEKLGKNEATDNILGTKYDIDEKAKLAAAEALRKVEEAAAANAEKRRRVESDLSILQAQASGKSVDELHAMKEKETTTRRIFDLEKQLVAEGLNRAEAGKKSLEIAQAESTARAQIKARETATQLRDIYAEMLIKDLQIAGANEAQLTPLRTQITLQKRIEELKKSGLATELATKIASEESAAATALENQSRGKNLLMRTMELEAKEARAKGDTKKAKEMETQLKLLNKMKEIQSSTDLGEKEAFDLARREVSADITLEGKSKTPTQTYSKKRKNSRIKFAKTDTTELPTFETFAAYNREKREGGALGRLRENQSQFQVPATKTPLPDIGKPINKAGDDIVAGLKDVGNALTTNFDKINQTISDLEKQIKNSR
jgi:hypothetical protein